MQFDIIIINIVHLISLKAENIKKYNLIIGIKT